MTEFWGFPESVKPDQKRVLGFVSPANLFSLAHISKIIIGLLKGNIKCMGLDSRLQILSVRDFVTYTRTITHVG